MDEAAEVGASEPTLIGVLRDGGWVFVLVGFFARLPPAMLTLGVTLYAAERLGVPWLRLVPVGLSVAAVGVVFGATSTGVAASLSAQGRPALSGIVYGGMGVGSALSGLLTTRLPRGLSQRSRVVIFAGVLALVAPLVAIAPAPLWLMAACFLCGCGLAPVLIGSFAIAEGVSPLARIGTVMTALGTCIVAGVAVGSSLAGLLIDGYGPSSALLLPTAAGLAALLAAVMARAQRVIPGASA